MYKYIFFDLDGTLTDPFEGITKSVKYALEHFGVHEDNLDNLKCFIGPPLKNSFMDFYGFDEKKAEEAVIKYRERFKNTGIYENKVYDGINSMLESLKFREKKIVLATSKPEVFAVDILKHFNLYDYFDCVAGSDFEGKRPDKASVIRYAMEFMENPDKSEIIMVGDRLHDVHGAKETGIKCVGVKFGYAEDGELEKAGADYILSDVQELNKFLLEN